MRRYTEEEKVEILKKVKNIGNVSLIDNKHGLPFTTIQNWIRKGLNQSDTSEIKRLKKTFSQQKLEIFTKNKKYIEVSIQIPLLRSQRYEIFELYFLIDSFCFSLFPSFCRN